MFWVKILFGSLLCCPLAYIISAIFTSLVDEATK